MKKNLFVISTCVLAITTAHAQWKSETSTWLGTWEDKVYAISKDKSTWWEAQWNAEQSRVWWKGQYWVGQLAVPSSREEAQWIWKNTAKKTLWVGAYWNANSNKAGSTDTWKWISKESLKDSSWKWNQSKSWNPKKQWFLSTSPSGDQWGWWEGNTEHNYLIEYRPEK